MREEVDFLREKYYSSRRFENTTVQTHLNGVSVIFLSFPETPGGESFEGVEFTEAIMANANANGIMANSMRISPGDQLCTVKMGGGEKIIRSDIGGELSEINLNITSISGDCKSSSWIAILINSKY